MGNGAIQKRPQAGEGHFSQEDYLAFVIAWSKSSIAQKSKIEMRYDPRRDCPFRVELSLLNKDDDLFFETAFDTGGLRLWRGNFHSWK
jgi:hypothetical protein